MGASNETSTKQEFQEAAHGCSTILPAKSQVPIAGTPMLPAAMASVFTQAVASMNKVAAGRAALKADVAAEKVAMAAAHLLFNRLQNYLRSAWGEGNPQLAQFGMKGRKQSSSTATSRAAGAKQAAATRKALGPIGKQQRKAAVKLVTVAATGTGGK